MPTAALTDARPFCEERSASLAEYLSQFQSVFQRADQFERFGLYIRGLLEPSVRKNVGAIAAAARDAGSGNSDLTQALQHFISQSPWDSDELLAGYRRIHYQRPDDPEAVYVIHDGVFPKKGRHSVGVQRQFARSVGRKLNCQMAVVVGQIGPKGYFPLAARLYLPTHWLQEHPELAEKAVPEVHRQPISKFAIALNLIDELRAERRNLPELIAEEGYATLPAFRDGLEARQIAFREGNTSLVAEAHRQFDHLRITLGLDHFEGRSWLGWHHHVSLVFVANGFLSSDLYAD